MALIDRIFVSFPGEHRDQARRIVEALQQAGADIWYDEPRLKGGDPITDACVAAAAESRHLVAVVGEATFASTYQRAEIGQFEGRDPKNCSLVFVQLGQRAHSLSHGLKVLRDETRPEVIGPWVLSAFGLEPRPTGKTRITLTSYRAHVVSCFQALLPWAGGPGAIELARVVVHSGLMEGPESRRPRTSRGKRAVRGVDSVLLAERELSATRLEDLLEPGARLLMWGEPGAGKTTLFRHLAWSLADGERDGVPICLRLADPEERNVSPVFAAARQMGFDDPSLPAEAARLAELAGATRRYPVILLDGLDEVPPGEVGMVLAWIDTLPGNAAVLVSARKQLADELPKGRFREVEVRPLDLDQQRELLGNLLSAQDADALAEVIAIDPRLEQLARSPLLLTLLAVLVREDARGLHGLPRRRGELFRDATRLLLMRGHGVVAGAQGVAVRDVRAARSLLGELALRLHATSGEAWSEDDVFHRLVALREDPRTRFLAIERQFWEGSSFQDDMARNAGVFGPLDGGHMPWRFFHRTFREYLAAYALCWGPPARRDVWFEEQKKDILSRHRELKEGEERPSSRWGEVHALLCGMVRDPKPLILPLLGEGPGVGVRAVLDADGLSPEDAAGLLLRQDDADWEHLEPLMKGWDLEEEEKAEVLLEAVSPALGPKALGMVWFAVEQLTGGAPEREAFFTQAGRWPVGGPALPETVPISAGSFVMGATQAEWQRLKDSRWPDWIGERERPPHQVSLTQPYRLGVTPVTQAEYAVFDKDWSRRLSAATASRHPIYGVCWWEAFAYCRWLGGSLPTEAEWEYACRAGKSTAGTSTAFWSGDTKEDLLRVAWVRENSKGGLPTVGGKPANPWGLHDMHGLVWEWCEDPLRTYDGQPTTDPRGAGPPAGSRVVRGGSFRLDPVVARSACRDVDSPSELGADLGFRVRLPPALERGSMEP